MANPEHVEILKQGVDLWNKWRKENPEIKPDLREAKLLNRDLKHADLSDCDLCGADLSNADLAHAYLVGADLRGKVRLYNAHLNDANLSDSKLWNANLYRADLSHANLEKANLRDADLRLASLVDTKVANATLTGCKIYGISIWNLRGKPKEQNNLRITREYAPFNESTLVIDNLLVAQFIYLLSSSDPEINQVIEFNEVIDTIASKVVLILGSFKDERRSVLHAICRELRGYGLAPMMFEFPRPDTQDYMGPVLMFGSMAKFIIADFTDAKTVIEEAPKVVQTCNKLLVPLLQKGYKEPIPLLNLRSSNRDYVLDTCWYPDVESLLESLLKSVVDEATKKAEQLTVNRKKIFGPVDDSIKDKRQHGSK